MTDSILEKYKPYMQSAFSPYCSRDQFIEHFGRYPSMRYRTFKYCWDHVMKNNLKTIVEIGTSRSFVDGMFEGCNSDDTKYWQPDNCAVWDWSAGCFTRVFGELIQGTDIQLTTVDVEQRHLLRCQKMTQDLENISYKRASSESFLSESGNIDFLYMDTGDMTPIEATANLHLRESQIIVEKNLISEKGVILIDDVRNITPRVNSGEKSEYGKAKYSIPYLLENGFEIVMDEYQVVMKRGPNER